MRFLRPDLARWALVMPLLVMMWELHRHARRASRRQAAVAVRFAPLSRRSAPARDLAVLAAALVCAGSVVFALVRPQAVLTHRIPDYARQDLVIMLDRSASMKAQDILPSRSARATREIRNFVRHKPDGIDRIALVGFADASVILSYLTEDVESILFYFDWIDADSTPLFGTNIGAALTSAMDVAKRDARPTGKLFLIVSDGEDNGAELSRALSTARAEAYRVHCIGIGSDDPVPIPMRAPDGRNDFLRDDAGRSVTTRFSERTLRDIASATGGRYVRSTTGDELQRGISTIIDGERKPLGWRTLTEYRDLYPACLAVAAIAGAGLWLLL